MKPKKWMMKWKSKTNPDIHGEGKPVDDEEEAHAICRHHNWLYGFKNGFVHHAEEIETPTT